jgi:hypothetical protein
MKLDAMSRTRRTAAALAFACAALFTATSNAQETSGFLSDYAQLQPVPGNPGLVRYAAPEVRSRLTQKVFLAPIEVWISPSSKYKGIDPDEIKKLTDEMRTVIVSELQPRFRFVDAPESDAMTLRVALTNVHLEKDPLRLRQFTPIGLAVKGVKAVAGVSNVRLQSAAVEVEGYAPDGKERLFAWVDRRTTAAGKPAGEVRLDQVMDEVRERAKRMRGMLEGPPR